MITQCTLRPLAAALALAFLTLPGHAAGPAYLELVQAKQPADQQTAACSPSQNDKYADLAHKLTVPADEAQYGRCHDFGRWDGKEYAGYTSLTPGYWVYAYPDWYVWRTRR